MLNGNFNISASPCNTSSFSAEVNASFGIPHTSNIRPVTRYTEPCSGGQKKPFVRHKSHRAVHRHKTQPLKAYSSKVPYPNTHHSKISHPGIHLQADHRSAYRYRRAHHHQKRDHRSHSTFSPLIPQQRDQLFRSTFPPPIDGNNWRSCIYNYSNGRCACTLGQINKNNGHQAIEVKEIVSFQLPDAHKLASSYFHGACRRHLLEILKNRASKQKRSLDPTVMVDKKYVVSASSKSIQALSISFLLISACILEMINKILSPK